MAYIAPNPNGQASKTNSSPVVLPSDYQAPVAAYNLDLSGTITAASTAAFTQNMFGYSWIGFQITGTWVGTIVAQVSNDNTNWNSVGVMAASATTSTPATSFTGNGQWSVAVTGKYFRIFSSAWTSGTATVTAYASSIPTGYTSVGVSAVINAFNPASGSTGLTTIFSDSYAGALLSVKTSNARLFEYDFYNPNTTGVWIQMFNAASTGAVTLGTTTPLRSVYVPPSSGRDWFSTYSPNYGNGLVIAATTAVKGTTAPTTPIQYYIGYV